MTRVERRRRAFKELAKGRPCMADVLKRKVTPVPRGKTRPDVVQVDSRFSEIWYRILAHIAADHVSKTRVSADWPLLCAAEGAIEDCEDEVVNWLMPVAEPEFYAQVKAKGACVCLF